MSIGHGYGEGDNSQSRRIWDMKPTGGGEPVIVTVPVVDAQEWIVRDPDRYAYHTPGEPPPCTEGRR
jgi:hypothetical protein